MSRRARYPARTIVAFLLVSMMTRIQENAAPKLWANTVHTPVLIQYLLGTRETQLTPFPLGDA